MRRFPVPSFPVLSPLVAARPLGLALALGAAVVLPVPHAAATSSGSAPAAANPTPFTGFPAYEAPESYRVDLVMSAQGKSFTMKRFLSKGRTRSEIVVDKGTLITLEMGDEAGTIYQLDPKGKQAIKMTTAVLREQMADVAEEATEPAPADVKLEDLGTETLDGVLARKFRITSPEGVATGWCEAATGAPLRVESENQGKQGVIEWKNRTAGPQPEALFQVPDGYEIMDLDAMMAEMKGAPGMSGMMKGMMGGMMGGMIGGLGAQAGGAFGGPVGSMFGQYVGGRMGGMLTGGGN